MLHDKTMRASVVDMSNTVDKVVLGRTEALQNIPFSLESSLILAASLEELESHGRTIEDRDSAVDDTTPSTSQLKQDYDQTKIRRSK